MPRYQKGGYRSKKTDETSPQSQRKPQLTHFLCIPLINATSRPQLEASLARFRSEISSGQNRSSAHPEEESVAGGVAALKRVDFPALPEKAIRPVGTLHLTLGVMSLPDRSKVEAAISFLEDVDVIGLLREASVSASGTDHAMRNPEEIAPVYEGKQKEPDVEPLRLSLHGLESMHPLHRTSVLYAAPKDVTSRLLPFGESLRASFTAAGFMLPDDRPLKLHATIVNTIYAKHLSGSVGRSLRQESQTSGADEKTRQQMQGIRSKVLVGKGMSEVDMATKPNASFGASPDVPERTMRHEPHSKGQIKLDASVLVDHFKEFEWARDVTLEKVAICKMGAKKMLGKRGEVIGEEYEEVAAIPLPI